MIELVYYSISNAEVTEELLNDILNKARNFNSKNNITGCLLYHNKIFLQLLEGEETVVQNLFENIKKDNRHSNVTHIITENIKKRMFSDWSMAFHDFKNNKSAINQFIKTIDFYSNNNDQQTEAIDQFWRMAKQIIVK